MRFITVLVGLQRTTVIDLRFGEVLLLVVAVSAANITCLFLCKNTEAAKDQGRRNDMTSCRFSEDIQLRNGFVLSVEDKEIDH